MAARGTPATALLAAATGGKRAVMAEVAAAGAVAAVISRPGK